MVRERPWILSPICVPKIGLSEFNILTWQKLISGLVVLVGFCMEGAVEVHVICSALFLFSNVQFSLVGSLGFESASLLG